MKRVGIGYDIHRLEQETGASITLCGITIPCDHRLVAHSDGDVAFHALTDAVLGACGAGDIGEHFPDNDPRWCGAESRHFLTAALTIAAERGWRLINCDLNIIAQQPRLGPWKAALRAALAEALDLAPDAASLKARSNEGLDAIGTSQAIAAQAVVLLDTA